MRCIKCGKEVSENEKFCIYCGAPLDGQSFGQPPSDRQREGKGKRFLLIAVLVAAALVVVIVLYMTDMSRKSSQSIKQSEAALAEDEKDSKKEDAKDREVEEEDSSPDNTSDMDEEEPVQQEPVKPDPVEPDTTVDQNIPAPAEENQNQTEPESSGEYILEGSDSRYISESELHGLTQEEIKLARNELYARHGRKFDDAGLRNYFSQFDWYHPTIEPADFQESMLNDYEVANRDLIVKYEKEHGYN